MKLYYNSYKNDLYCVYCKERIFIGEKYIIDYEIYNGETIEKYYHVDHFEPINDEDNIYISDEE